MKNTVADYMASLLAAPTFTNQITHHRVDPARSAAYAEPRRPWPRAIADILEKRGIPSLYSHQAEATDILRAGHDLVVATPTASGKTLCYNLPILEQFLKDPDCRVLMLFPLKALAQDQLAAFNALTASWPRDARPTAAIYDGDTSDYTRRKIRRAPPNVLITNPEMLHLAILPFHAQWTTFLASLSLVVVDEAHTYRGVFGSHISQLFRRMERICGRYNARPNFILCTATVGNPGELAASLTGRHADDPSAFPVIRHSGAPTGNRHFVFIDPLKSPANTAITLLQSALARNLRTIVYCRSRRMTELIAVWAQDKKTGAGDFADRISAYRAGFLPEERREIEARMSSGELLAVVSTSALELGIDIGNLDICILVGYPGTVMSTLQRGGRVGRSGQESAVILIAGEDALDQYFIHTPEAFFAREAEKAIVNPDNEVILRRHLECGAAELPLHRGEAWLRGETGTAVLGELEREGLLLQSSDGQEWFAARKRPQRDVNLRGSGGQITIVDEDGNPIGSVDEYRAYRETHPGAVYLHRGRTYIVKELDLGTRQAVCTVPKFQVNWHTNVRSTKETAIIKVYRQATAFGASTGFGKLRVTETITGYEKRAIRGNRLMSITPLDFAPFVFETEGMWFSIPDGPRRAVEDGRMHFMGSIHALEHACIGLMPLMVMADRNDFGGISIPMHAQTGTPTVFIYDGLPGGAGLCRAAFPDMERLFLAVRDLLERCPCETGCPSCVHSPKCGSGNRPIDKAGALFLLERMIAEPAPEKPIGISLLPELEQRLEVVEPSGQRTAEGSTDKNSGQNTVQAPSQSTPSGSEAGSHQISGPLSGNDTPPAPRGKPRPLPDRYVVFDVETRRSAGEVGGWNRTGAMGVSVAVLYDSSEDKYFSYLQEEIPAMLERMRQADVVIGFNSSRFDYGVLQPFADWNLHELPTLDLLTVIHRRLSYRVSLDNLGRATLDAPKSANGLLALRWWREGKIDEIAKYCQKDVEITRDLYLFGHENGYVLFTNKAGQKVRVPIEW